MFGPKFLKHKEVFIRCVHHVFANWLDGQYNNDTTVMYAIEKGSIKKLPSEEGYEVWAFSIQVKSEDFPPRVVEKLGRQEFAKKSGAKQEYKQYTQELPP